MTKTQWFNHLYKRIGSEKVQFLLVFFVIMTISYGILYFIDFIPEPVSENGEEVEAAENTDEPFDWFATYMGGSQQNDEVEVAFNDALPLSITFDALDKTVKVLNPTSRSVEELDKALLSGVVRHPDSADFSDEGNMFILGHSSYLPNVFNKNFQAFNGIQNLTWGDTVRVRSTDVEYVYRVDRVYKARASEVEVPVNTGEARLTLATCNSFGSKDDRFVVEASLIERKAL